MGIHGIVPALTTPFDAGGALDGAALRHNIECYERTGLAGYLVAGSTGEGLLLDEGERSIALHAARAAIPPGKPLIAGVTAESTAGALRQIRAAADCGADVALVATPHYFRDQMTAEALLAHFGRIAEGSPLPVLLYNVPKFTGLALPADVVVEAARHPNVTGIKESSGDLDYAREILRRSGAGFRLLCGASSRVAEALAAGAAGAILAAAAAIPEPFVELDRRARAGDLPGAAAIQAAVAGDARILAGDYGVPGVKAAVDLRGLAGGVPRSPLQPLSAAGRERIGRRIEALVEAGILSRCDLARP